MDADRSLIVTILAIVCLTFALVFGLLAIAAGGGFWLLLIAALWVLAAVVLDVVARRSGSVSEALMEPLAAVAIAAAVLLVGYAVVRTAVGSGSAPHVATPRLAAPPSATAPAAPPHASAPSSSVRPSTPNGSPTSSPSTTAVIGRYVTAGRDVHLRAAASTSSATLAIMTAFATPVALSCYQEGEPVFSAPYWYRASYDGIVGYVSELWLDAGADPTRTGLAHC